jgi:hypothetical protein
MNIFLALFIATFLTCVPSMVEGDGEDYSPYLRRKLEQAPEDKQ